MKAMASAKEYVGSVLVEVEEGALLFSASFPSHRHGPDKQLKIHVYECNVAGARLVCRDEDTVSSMDEPSLGIPRLVSLDWVNTAFPQGNTYLSGPLWGPIGDELLKVSVHSSDYQVEAI